MRLLKYNILIFVIHSTFLCIPACHFQKDTFFTQQKKELDTNSVITEKTKKSQPKEEIDTNSIVIEKTIDSQLKEEFDTNTVVIEKTKDSYKKNEQFSLKDNAIKLKKPIKKIKPKKAHLLGSHKKELIWFGMNAMGLRTGIDSIKKVLPMKDVHNMIKTGLNMNGMLCAEITDLVPLRMKYTYEVTCIAYRGGTKTKSYVINAQRGVAEDL